jgi:superfamily II DNA or RNA helicase
VDSRIDEIELRLTRLAAEKADLESELIRLRQLTAFNQVDPTLIGRPARESVPVTDDERSAIFLDLFRCRESVYARLWERPEKGIKGYSPVCNNEWIRGVCGKPPNGRVKCGECPNQAFPPLDMVAARTHLSGKATIGSYAIREDDTCVFLACDFDGPGWLDDAFLYQSVARRMGVDVLVERSRSGDGAHAWIFFSAPIQARLGRALGTLILAKCGEHNYRLGLESYDRLFPNQDYLPKGGFGNLIALPLQGKASELGNTVFIRPDGRPWADQWAVLSRVSRLSPADVQGLLWGRLAPQGSRDREDVSLTTDSHFLEDGDDLRGSLPPGSCLELILGSQLEVPLAGLSSKVVTALRRLASFPNPEFYKLQRMRMQTYPHQRFIFAGELRPHALVLPRGLQERATKALEIAGAKVALADRRTHGTGITCAFSGTLTAPQLRAAQALIKLDTGVLVAPPCALIAERGVSTLILLHKQPLVEQWKERLSMLLGVTAKSIGVLAGTKKKRTGQLDVAMLQTLSKSPNCGEILAQYGQVIVDECHHVPATSFEAVMKQCSSRYVLGLTATPKRKDGLEKLLYMQCGPIRHEIKDGAEGLAKKVIIRETGFKLPDHVGHRPAYHVIAHLLSSDEARNVLISQDLIAAIQVGRFPLVLSDRREQIEALRLSVSKHQIRCFVLEGSLSAKKRNEVLAELASSRSDRVPVCLFATASLIGEGFDLPELDTLFLTMPLSFEGRLIQYAGRLNRQAIGKDNVLVHDYVDSHCAVSLKMYRNRMIAFRRMGYSIESPKSLFGRSDPPQAVLFESC